MELQGLHEALKVELQCHQNQSLCKGLNELQNGQKLSVRTLPVGPSKPLSLIKPPAPGIAISVVPAKAPVSMVTAHTNGQKVASSEPLQTSPINLQTAASRAAPAGALLPYYNRRTGDMPPSQMLGTLTAVPIKVPQVGSLHRLTGQAATVLPQVRPKVSDSAALRPCQELPRATAIVSPKSNAAANAAANGNFRSEHQPNGQGGVASSPSAPSGGADSGGAAQHAAAGPGVAYAIIAASPATGASAAGEAVQVRPLILSADHKVIIIQPQAPGSTEGADLPPPPPQEAPPTNLKAPPLQKDDEDPEKIAFMVALGLVTTEHLEEIQSKRQERKRRSTANPAYSGGLFEPERKRLASHYLNSSLYLTARDCEDLCWKEDVEHDDHCAVCKEEGELQPCHNCPRAFHPDCLQPPLRTPPRAAWYCPKCQKKVLNKENMSWPQNFVQSYVTHKTVRQEEKRRLLRRNNELKKECSHLEEQDKQLSMTLKQCEEVRQRLLGRQREAQASLERVRSLVRLIQSEQLIQVTMTTMTTSASMAAAAAASLLSQSWIKPTSTAAAAATAAAAGSPAASPLHKSHAHSQDNN